MLPSRLVAVRRYPLVELADDDHRVLLNAGIAAYVKGSRFLPGDATLVVPEEQLEAAREALASSPPIEVTSPDDPAFRCPHCGSNAVDPRPPYALLTILGGAIVTIALYWYDRGQFVTVAGLATAVLAAVVFGLAARWRCRSCNRQYGRSGG